MIVDRYMSQREFIMLMAGEKITPEVASSRLAGKESNKKANSFYFFPHDISSFGGVVKVKPNDLERFSDEFKDAEVLVQLEVPDENLEKFSKEKKLFIDSLDSQTRVDIEGYRISEYDSKMVKPLRYIVKKGIEMFGNEKSWRLASEYIKDDSFVAEKMYYEFEKAHQKHDQQKIVIREDAEGSIRTIASSRRESDVEKVGKQLEDISLRKIENFNIDESKEEK